VVVPSTTSSAGAESVLQLGSQRGEGTWNCRRRRRTCLPA